MDREQTLQALEEISDKHIEETAKRPKKRKKIVFRSAVAAVLAFAVCLGVFFTPAKVNAKAVALPGECRSSNYMANMNTLKETRQSLQPFFVNSSREFLTSNDGANKLWSPINAYIGLAMLTELTAGESKQQIMDLLGAESSEKLRKQVSTVWEAIYNDSDNERSTLANSLWMQEGVEYEQSAMEALAYHYYASVYQGQMGSEGINSAIRAWLDDNTGGLLKEYTKKVSLSPDTVLALYSTIYFQSKWQGEFSKKNNTRGTFHGAKGDQTVTYMNKKEAMMYYYWDEDFAAVAMTLKNGSTMWFILPDEDKTTADVLSSGRYLELTSGGEWENKKYMKVNLTVPKFDISGQITLNEGLKKLGVKDIFDPDKANFSAITSEIPLYTSEIKQSVRVEIDEEGVKAAAYIELPGVGSAQPPEEIIDFVLDRPFLFVIANSGLPVFTGVVNAP